MTPEQKFDEMLSDLENVVVEAEGRAFEARGQLTLFRLTGQAMVDEALQLLVRARGLISSARSTNRFRREVKAGVKRADAQRGRRVAS